jgi:hypothetical protein
MVLILSSLGPNTVRTLEQMGLGEEYNSVAETDDSGLFFQWWDGLKVHKGGEVSSSKSPLIPIPDNPRSDIHKVSPFRRPPRPTPRSPARFPPRKRHSPPRRPRHRRQEPHIRRQSPNHIHCFPTSAWLHACPSRRCSTRPSTDNAKGRILRRRRRCWSRWNQIRPPLHHCRPLSTRSRERSRQACCAAVYRYILLPCVGPHGESNGVGCSRDGDICAEAKDGVWEWQAFDHLSDREGKGEFRI